MASARTLGPGIAKRTAALVVLWAAVVGPCLCNLRVLTRSDTVYIAAVPFYSIMAVDIAVQGDWVISMAACHEGLPFQDLFTHRGQGPMDEWPFALQWNEHADIHVNISLYDPAAGRGWYEYKKFNVRFLEPVSYLLVDPTQGQHLRALDTGDDTVTELVGWAVEELSTTRRVVWNRVSRHARAAPPAIAGRALELAACGPGRMPARLVAAPACFPEHARLCDVCVCVCVCVCVRARVCLLSLYPDQVRQALLLTNFPVEDGCQRASAAGRGAEDEDRGEEDGGGDRDFGAGGGETCTWAQTLAQRSWHVDKSRAADLSDAEVEVAQLYITLEAFVFEGPTREGVKMDYLLGIRRHVGGRGGAGGLHPSFFAPTLIHAQEVPAAVLGEPQSLGDLSAQGVCARKEQQIDEDLAPWEATGGVVSEEVSYLMPWSRRTCICVHRCVYTACIHS